MSEVLVVLVIVALLVAALVVGGVVWGTMRAVDASARAARRTRQRVADTLPPSAFGRQLWYLATRLDRVSDYADWSRRTAARSGFATEVAEMATDLDHGCAVVRAQLRGCSSLRGAQRHDQLSSIEAQIAPLEDGARMLVDFVMQVERRAGGHASPGADVAQRAAFYRQALDELHEIADVQAQIESDQAVTRDVVAIEQPSPQGWVPPLPAPGWSDSQSEKRVPRRRRTRPQAD